MGWDYYKEFITRGLREPRFSITPEPDLPRAWRFYADPGFYMVLGFLCLYYFYPVYVFLTTPRDYWDPAVTTVVLIVMAILPAMLLWVAWDTYRWNYPHRLGYVFFICLFTVMVIVFYLHSRSSWVMEAQRQARMHRLGIKDE